MPTDALLAAQNELERRTRALAFGPPVAHVYRPLAYARELAEAYVRRFGDGPKEYVLVGMNPGPFGMGQTGVPFGEVSAVRDWMKLDGAVRAPKDAHPKRPIEGLACTRSEVSGARLWGAARARYPEARDFFARAYVVNYCPLLFLGESGANVTPDKLRKDERTQLEAVCRDHLARVVALLRPGVAVGVGAYATKALEQALAGAGAPPKLLTIPHPSPASPAANRGWLAIARKPFEDAGLDPPF